MSKLEELYASDPVECACAVGFLAAVPPTARVGWVGANYPAVAEAIAECRTLQAEGPWDDLLVMQVDGDIAVDGLTENGVLHILVPTTNELGFRAEARRSGFAVMERMSLRNDGRFSEAGSDDEFVLLRLSRNADDVEARPPRPVALLFDHPQWLRETHDKLRIVLSASGYELRDLAEAEARLYGARTRDDGWRPPREILRVGVNRRVGLGDDVDAMARTLFEGHADPELEETLRERVAATYRGLRSVIAKTGADLVVTMNGTTPLGYAAAEAARAEGAATLALENSFLRDRFFAEPLTGAVGNRHSLARFRFDRRRLIALDPAEEERLDSYLRTRDTASSFDGSIRQDEPLDVAEVRRQLEIPEGDRIAVLLGQVAYDSVITLDNPHYENSAEFLEAVVEAFREREGWTLVIRLHPKEALQGEDCTARRLKSHGTLPANTRLVVGRQMNTYSIMDAATVGLTINSQTGLELIARGKPCLVAGDAFYAGKGFTRDLPGPTLLRPMIDDLLTRSDLEGTEQELSRRFLHELIFDFTVPYDLGGMIEALPKRLREGRTLPSWPRTRLTPELPPILSLILVASDEDAATRIRPEIDLLESGRIEVLRVAARPGPQLGRAVLEALSRARCTVTAVADDTVILSEHTLAVMLEQGLDADDHLVHVKTSPHVDFSDSVQIALGRAGGADGARESVSISGHVFVGSTAKLLAHGSKLDGAESLWECSRRLETVPGPEHLPDGTYTGIPVRVPRHIDDILARSRAVARARQREGETISRTPERTAETLETLLGLLESTSPPPTEAETEHLRSALSRLLVVLIAAPLELELRPTSATS